MTVLSDIKIKLDTEELTAYLHEGKSSRKLVTKAEEVLNESKNLLQPAAAYEQIKILEVTNNAVLCSGINAPKVWLNIGQCSELMKKAAAAITSVVTIGFELDKRVKNLNLQGDYLSAWLMDAIGLIALEQAVSKIQRTAVIEAKKNMWRTGPFLSPGSIDGWPLSEQKKFCSLVPIDRIDVQLNKSNVLVPLKSVSGIIGIGPEYSSGKIESICRFCAQSSSCRIRAAKLKMKLRGCE
ncbi:hypothetical protein BuS5_00154 [Desulfosarcina sp. BuS5]|uniref:hypothetical protein n=1 Tax=Desulfosarcina sp. BuS5 TaxID=933262 RepID=UPI00047FDDEF|nr:hypothetical protein [Desulfosarcina sp. BuS5]WDN87186.1 hypothetical protein BuS5_00154 [Desulfosarcina sp. BuS5]